MPAVQPSIVPSVTSLMPATRILPVECSVAISAARRTWASSSSGSGVRSISQCATTVNGSWPRASARRSASTVRRSHAISAAPVVPAAR